MKVDVVETNLDFTNLSERGTTDMIVLHHTGSVQDMDFSAERIHEMHIGQGWAGIGYHFVIRKDGTIERGRPEWAIGSHAYGENSHSVGIHLSGDFNVATPTEAQIEKCAMLIADLCEKYGIPTDRGHIVGHGELMATGCPGRNLQALLDNGTITGKANGYAHGASQNTVETSQPENRHNGLVSDGIPVQASQNSTGTSQEGRIWLFLKGKGLNDYAAAGVMGNLYAESGLIPTNLENRYESKLGMTDAEYTAAVDSGSYDNFARDSAGYGLAQWTYGSRKQGLLELAKSKGMSIGDLGAQLEYLWQEMQGYHGMMAKLKNAASVQEASDAVLLDFERPADQSEAVRFTRARYGQEFYDKYAGREMIDESKEENEVRYNSVNDLPNWARPTIEKMMAKGLLNGNGESLDLSLDMVRVFVIHNRAGLYG